MASAENIVLPELPPELRSMPEERVRTCVRKILDGARSPAEMAGLSPEEVDVIYDIGHQLYSAGQLEDAARVFAACVLFEPNHSQGLRGLGAVAQANGDIEAAAGCYGLATIVDPLDVASWVFFGETLCLLPGRRDEGLQVLQFIVDRANEGVIDPRWGLWVSRARALTVMQGKTPPNLVLLKDGEVKAGGRAAGMPEELTFEHMQAIPEMREAIQDLKRMWAAGRVSLKDVGGFADGEMDAAYACACKYLDMGQIKECLQIAAVLLLLDQFQPRYYTLIGICAQRSGITELAVYMYETALGFDPKHFVARGYLGECRILEGDVEGGVAHVREAIALGAGDEEHAEVRRRFEAVVEQYG